MNDLVRMSQFYLLFTWVTREPDEEYVYTDSYYFMSCPTMPPKLCFLCHSSFFQCFLFNFIYSVCTSSVWLSAPPWLVLSLTSLPSVYGLCVPLSLCQFVFVLCVKGFSHVPSIFSPALWSLPILLWTLHLPEYWFSESIDYDEYEQDSVSELSIWVWYFVILPGDDLIHRVHYLHNIQYKRKSEIKSTKFHKLTPHVAKRGQKASLILTWFITSVNILQISLLSPLQ